MPDVPDARRTVQPPRGGVTLGVDLGGTKSQVVALRRRRVVGSVRVLTPQTGADAVIAAIVSAAHETMAAAGATAADLKAVGIGTPGTIHEDGGVSNSPNV